MLKLMYITNQPEVAKIADKNGVYFRKNRKEVVKKIRVICQESGEEK